jgi:hypothetical protein
VMVMWQIIDTSKKSVENHEMYHNAMLGPYVFCKFTITSL